MAPLPTEICGKPVSETTAAPSTPENMDLIASFATAYAVMRLLGQSTLTFVQVGLLLVAGCELVEAAGSGKEIPVVMSTGNLAFGTLLALAVTL